jgi:MFS family permease
MADETVADFSPSAHLAILRSDWVVVVACMVGIAVCSTPVALLSLSVFIKPLGAALGWGRGQVGLAVSAICVAMAIATPVAGRMIDRLGVRQVLSGSLVAYGLCLAATPWMISQLGLAGLYLAYFLLGILGAGSNTVAYVHVLSNRFDRRRGFVLGLAMSGLALGAAVHPPLAAALIARYGWAAGFYGLALMPLIIGLPVAVMFIGEGVRVVQESTARALKGMSARDATRTATFWKLFGAFLVVAACVSGLQLHLPALVSDRHFSPETSAAVLSLQFVVSAIVRVGSGLLLDVMFAPYVGAVLFLLSAVGSAALIPSGDPLFYLAASALIGVGAGAEVDLLSYLASRYFGLKAFGQIFGLIFSAFMIGAALGPFLFGIGFDHFHSYLVDLLCATAGLLIGAVLLLSLSKFPAEYQSSRRQVES